MFIGEYSHTIDAKGRLIVPSKFREQLGDEFVVTKGLDGCLFVYENSEWKSFEEKLHALPFKRIREAGKRRCIGRRRKPDRDLEQGGLEREECLR